MPMPGTIKVGPMLYTVEHSYESMRDYNSRADKEYCGVAIHRSLTIIIDGSMPECRARHTLLHELSHAIYYVYGVDGMDSKGDNYHDIVATSWLLLLRDNPGLVSYLMESPGA